MGKLVSGRVKRKPQTGITSDRYQFLGLDQAEPNLGDPTVGPSSTGANPIKVGTVYQLVSVDQNPGERFWTPISGIGTSVGAISVYNNGEIVTPNFFNTIHGLNFVGNGVTVIGPGVAGPFPGVGIATVNVGFIGLQNQGGVNQILYNTPSGNVSGAPDFYYLNNNIGIGSTVPKTKLDVIGNANFTGVVTASTFYGNVEGSIPYATKSGFATVAGYSTTSGVSTSVIGGIASVSQLFVTGVSTLGIFTANSGFIKTLTGENAVFSGIITAQFVDGVFIGDVGLAKTAENVVGGIASVTQLNVTGVSTLPIINGGSATFSGVVTASSFSGTATTAVNAVQLQTPRVINVVGPDFNSTGKSFNGTQNIDIDLSLKIQPGVTSGVYGSISQVPVIGVNSSGIVTSTSFVTLDTINNALYANVAGVATNVIGGIGSLSQLRVTGISTFVNGPVLIGTGTSTGTVNQPLQVNGGVYINGNVGIGVTIPGSKVHISNTGITTGEALQVDGNLRVGFSTQSNFIAFRGTFGDGVNASGGDQDELLADPLLRSPKYSHTFIGERIYQPNTEKSELLLFKGNGGLNTPNDGPDRIRHLAGAHVFQTYDNPLWGSFELVGSSNQAVDRFIIAPAGNVGIGTTNPIQKLDVAGNGRFTGFVTATTYYGDGSNLTNITNIGGIGSFTRLTVSGVSTLGQVKIASGIVTSSVGVVTYYGDGSYLTGVDQTSLPDERSIVYVDGNVTLDPDGFANFASIPSSVWTDLKANISVHKLDTWVGTAPPSNSPQAFLARRVVFPNLKLAFDSFQNRNPITRSVIIIYLYGTSDANAGLAVRQAPTCTYNGQTQIEIIKGPSQSALSGKPWINEHYTGYIQVPFTRVVFYRVNLNAGGTASNTNRYIQGGTFIFARNVIIRNSRFKFNTDSVITVGFIINTQTSLYLENSVEIYAEETGVGTPSEVEFSLDVFQPADTIGINYLSMAILTSSLLINSRVESQNPLTLTYNLKKTFLPAYISIVQGDCFCELNGVDGADLIIDGGFPVGTGARYGDINFVFNFTGSNTIGTFTWFRHNFKSQLMIIRDLNNSNSPPRSNHTISITGIGSYTSFVGLYAVAPIRFGGNTRVGATPEIVDNNNLLSKMKSAFTTAGISSANSYAWQLPAASYRDGQLGVGTIIISTPDTV